MHYMKFPVDREDCENPFQFDLQQVISFLQKDLVDTVVKRISLEGNQTTVQPKFILNPANLARISAYDCWAMQDSGFQERGTFKIISPFKTLEGLKIRTRKIYFFLPRIVIP